MRLAFPGIDIETTATFKSDRIMSHLIGTRTQELGLMVHNV